MAYLFPSKRFVFNRALLFILALMPLSTITIAQGDSAIDSAQTSNGQKQFVFTAHNKAKKFAQQQKNKGNTATIRTEKKTGKRYFVILKGYSQWAPAFKQAQVLFKQGFARVEVTKGRFERGYSVLAARFFDKKAAGQAFNKLKRMGLRNVKVHTDNINFSRYIVRVTTQKKSQPAAPIAQTNQLSQVKHVPQKKQNKTHIEKKIKKEATTEETAVMPGGTIEIEADNTDEDEMMIVMSDDISDINFEVDFAQADIDSRSDWGASFSLEQDLFTRDAQDASSASYIHADAYLENTINHDWGFRIAARLDGYYQQGNKATRYSQLDADYGDTFLRYRDDNFRITLGTQTIRWGRVDNLGPLDNMATVDLSRGVLLKWGENYRSSAAIRIESYVSQGKFDFVYLPSFREAQLSEKQDVWYPINQNTGRMLGFKSSPAMQALIQNADIDDDIDGEGGMGLRYSTKLNDFDVAMTVQRVRLSMPYYRLEQTAGQFTFKEEHERNWIIGADAAFDWKAVTWRMEAGWFSDLPATTTMLEYKTYNGFQWAGSAEFYPGDADTRVNLQLSGRHLNEREKILDLDNTIALSGEIESLFANERWKLSTRFNIGLTHEDYLLAPEIAFLGWEPFEVYSAFHYLDGAEQTIGGFYKDNAMLSFGVRGKY